MEKKIVCGFNTWPQLHKRFKDSPRRSRVISLIPLGLWQLYTELAAGLINYITIFLSVRKLSELLRLGSNLFHSDIVAGKKWVFEKSMFFFKNGKVVRSPSCVWSASNSNSN